MFFFFGSSQKEENDEESCFNLKKEKKTDMKCGAQLNRRGKNDAWQEDTSSNSYLF